MGNLSFLKTSLRKLHDPKAEEFVRNVIAEAAKKCPLDTLRMLGECLLADQGDALNKETLSN